ALGVPVVAVDLPSGVPSEPPWPAGFDGATTDGESVAFAAAVTVTFGGHKLCHVVEPARSACGRVDLVDIGLELPSPDLWCWTPPDVAAGWPVPGPLSDKYSRGVVGIDAGSPGFPGAAVLATAGAIGAGAGMVRLIGDTHVAQRVIDKFPSVVPGAGQLQARVLGCGWGERPHAARLVAQALDSGVPSVVDADALRHLPTGTLGSHVLLTPHAGELSRLLGCDRAEVVADPVAAVTAASSRHGATVLLKGATQFVASPGTTVQVAVPGPGWTAQAGSGDVLAGICGALLAAGIAAPEAASLAASMQAMAARAVDSPLSADRIAHLLPVRIGAILRHDVSNDSAPRRADSFHNVIQRNSNS
ncbi:MAG: NAD(P)H-hydrate dehydratase, partial [Propionicimonas sp.]